MKKLFHIKSTINSSISTHLYNRQLKNQHYVQNYSTENQQESKTIDIKIRGDSDDEK